MASNPMAWMPNGVGCCARVRLQIHAVEARAMLAIAGFQFDPYSDDGAAPGKAIPANPVAVCDGRFGQTLNSRLP